MLRRITLHMLALAMRGLPRDALLLMRLPGGSLVPVTLIQPGPITVSQDGTLTSAPGVSPMVEVSYRVDLEFDPVTR